MVKKTEFFKVSYPNCGRWLQKPVTPAEHVPGCSPAIMVPKKV